MFNKKNVVCSNKTLIVIWTDVSSHLSTPWSTSHVHTCSRAHTSQAVLPSGKLKKVKCGRRKKWCSLGANTLPGSSIPTFPFPHFHLSRTISVNWTQTVSHWLQKSTTGPDQAFSQSALRQRVGAGVLHSQDAIERECSFHLGGRSRAGIYSKWLHLRSQFP